MEAVSMISLKPTTQVIIVNLVGEGHAEAHAAATTRLRIDADSRDIIFHLGEQFVHFPRGIGGNFQVCRG